ncbi:hypothetical protein DPMN_160166 [Dreissena polymorpha]|uniref:Uncharacterized protein n=1 Tax=Dreissena polymorpha TaxID=45954 RepID=A0A9D4ISA6_DREPO|nr:hypothetical protein DPMN_160166 [Dreissena polymorpha]
MLIQIDQYMVANDTITCTGRQFNDKSCLVALKRTRLLCKGSAENKRRSSSRSSRAPLLLCPLDATSCRTEHENGFLSILSVLGTADLRYFRYLHRPSPRNPGLYLCHARPLRCQFLCTRPFSGDVVEPCFFLLTITIPPILPNYGIQRSQQKWMSGSRDDGTRLIYRVALRSLQLNLLRATLPPIATSILQLLTELC